MKIINNSLKTRRFQIGYESKPNMKDVYTKIQGYSFDLLDTLNGLKNKDIAFQPVHDYTKMIASETDIYVGDYMVVLACFCKKTIKASDVDLGVKKKIRALLEEDPNLDINKNLKGLRRGITDTLMQTTPLSFALKPIILNVETGEGFAIGCSETDFKEIMSYFGMIFGNVEIQDVPMFQNINFLKWLWYRMENNALKPVGDAEVTPLGIVDVIDADMSERIKSESDSLEEARLSLLRGLYPCKLGIGFVHGGQIDKVMLEGTFLFTLKADLAKFHDTEVSAYLDIFDKIKKVLSFLEILEAEYNEEEFTETQVMSWARGDFCRRNYSDL